ncbi:MAG: hypothetical protein MZV70_05065 [Desulfobacterales bacterium]|nr:hypothetical protein [Desulfobacterales bacterium]
MSPVTLELFPRESSSAPQQGRAAGRSDAAAQPGGVCRPVPSLGRWQDPATALIETDQLPR